MTRNARRRDGAPLLAVGTVGHRDLGGADLPGLRGVAETLFTEIRRRAGSGRGRKLRCISNAAEGADILLSQAAVRAGFELVCLLPKPRASVVRDLSGEVERAAFRDVLAAAAAVEEPDVPFAEPGSYVAAARALLARSHLLVAVWDGRPERGEGGTGQTVREARAEGLPVAVIDPIPPHGITRVGGGKLRTRAADLDRWLDRLPRWTAPS